MATNVYIENSVPAVKLGRGLKTKLPVTLSGTASTLAVGGTLTVTGASAFTGNVTFSGSRSGGTTAVISGSGATVTLTAAQSGSICLNDRAAGIVWTLPAPTAGMSFAFFTPTSVTSNSYKVITNTGTVLLIGSIMSIDSDSSNAIAAYTGDGATHIAVTMAAASTNATGGLQGSYLRFTCLSSTLWNVEGVSVAAGTPATPFATS